MSKVLELKNLSYVYGTGTPFEKTAVNNLSLSIEKGEFIGIMGHTGSGKSTLVQMLNGLMKPTSGQVLLDGEDIWANPKDIRKIRFKVGMVFQQPNPFPKSVYDNVAYGPRIAGIKKKSQLDEIVERSLRQAAIWDELKDRLNKSALGLSGGQQQRCAIARALVKNPKLLLCDEPTGALDSKTSREILILLEKINARYGTTMLIVTHNNSIKQMVHRVIFLKDGQIKKSYTNETRVPADKLEDL